MLFKKKKKLLLLKKVDGNKSRRLFKGVFKDSNGNQKGQSPKYFKAQGIIQKDKQPNSKSAGNNPTEGQNISTDSKSNCRGKGQIYKDTSCRQ